MLYNIVIDRSAQVTDHWWKSPLNSAQYWLNSSCSLFFLFKLDCVDCWIIPKLHTIIVDLCIHCDYSSDCDYDTVWLCVWVCVFFSQHFDCWINCQEIRSQYAYDGKLKRLPKKKQINFFFLFCIVLSERQLITQMQMTRIRANSICQCIVSVCVCIPNSDLS